MQLKKFSFELHRKVFYFLFPAATKLFLSLQNKLLQENEIETQSFIFLVTANIFTSIISCKF